MSALQTVLIGTTLREAGDVVVLTAIKVARAAGARFHLVHAVPAAGGPGHGAPSGPHSPFLDTRAGHGAALARRMDEQLERLGVGVWELAGRSLESGPAHRVVIDAAQRIGADLIVVGAAETRLARTFGSTARKVVRKARCPVLVVRHAMPLPPLRILLPVDLSPLAAETVAEGLDLVARLGAGVTGSRTAETVTAEAFHVAVPLIGEPEDELRAQEAGARADLDEFLTRHSLGADWKVERRVAVGSAAAEILDRIERWRPDLVVVGTHGYGGFERLMLGSIAEDVISQSAANLLVIPPRAARAAAAHHGKQTVEERRTVPAAV